MEWLVMGSYKTLPSRGKGLRKNDLHANSDSMLLLGDFNMTPKI